MRIITILYLIIHGTLEAVTTPPRLLRACINSADSTITISWSPTSDACASFTKYSLYASYDGGAYTKLIDIINIAQSEYPHKLPAISTKWQYLMRVHSTCNGLDSLQSTTLSVDITRPLDIQLDSVSYDITSQHIIAGWRPNTSPDTKNYKLYDFTSGNGDSIGNTTTTTITISTDPTDRFPVVIATLDSCNLSSLISTPHTAMYLTGSIDTCLKEIILNWIPYQGWSMIDSQSVFVSINASPFFKYTTLLGNTNLFTYNALALGDEIRFYIRAYTKLGTISSSSNLLSFKTRKPKAPENLYLSNVTVIGNDIELTINTTTLNDATTFKIGRGTNNTTLFPIFNLSVSSSTLEYQWVDTNTDPDNSVYYYRIIASDKCNDSLASSNTSNNILLSLNPNINHNAYNTWINGVSQYELTHQDQQGFTWNSLETSDNAIISNQYADSTGCFKIIAYEYNNSIYPFTRTSQSNIVCTKDSLITYITTGVNTQSTNNKFAIRGKGINHALSYYEIYNRWGELLVRNSTAQDWDLHYKEKYIASGSYLYIVSLYGVLGERRTEKGILNVIK